jgi:hypothetical protein
MIKKYVNANIGHHNMIPEMLCNRPGMTESSPITNNNSPKLRHKKTPIFQSTKGHSLENQAQKESVA